MGRKSEIPLDQRRQKFSLYQGDWERLESLLKGTKISPTDFIRRTVRKQILKIESRLNDQAKPVPEIKDDDLDTSELPTLSSEPEVA